MRHNDEKENHIDSLTAMLILSVLFVLVNVILTLNGMSPFALLK